MLQERYKKSWGEITPRKSFMTGIGIMYCYGMLFYLFTGVALFFFFMENALAQFILNLSDNFSIYYCHSGFVVEWINKSSNCRVFCVKIYVGGSKRLSKNEKCLYLLDFFSYWGTTQEVKFERSGNIEEVGILTLSLFLFNRRRMSWCVISFL